MGNGVAHPAFPGARNRHKCAPSQRQKRAEVKFSLFLCGTVLTAFGKEWRTRFFRHKREQPSLGRGTARTLGLIIDDGLLMIGPVAGRG
jgi:hypothetical protein